MQAFVLNAVAALRNAKGSLTDAQEFECSERAQKMYADLEEHGRAGWTHFQNTILAQMKANETTSTSTRRSRRDRKQKGTQKPHDFHRFKKLHDQAVNLKEIIGNDAKSVAFGLNSKLASAAWERCATDGKRDLFTEEKVGSPETARYIETSARTTIDELKKKLKAEPGMLKDMIEKQGTNAKHRRSEKSKRSRDASPAPKAAAKTETTEKKKRTSKKAAKSSSSSSEDDSSSSDSSD